MKKNMMFLTLMLALVLIVSACGKAAPVTPEATGEGSSTATTESKTISVKHALDENPVQVKVNPKNVVVFDFGSLDTLDKLGVDVAAVAQQDLPTYLSKYKDSKYASAGTLFEPDYEKISDLSPELIIIGGRQADAYKELSKIAPTISMAVDTKDYINSFKRTWKRWGKSSTKRMLPSRNWLRLIAPSRAYMTRL